MYKIKNHFKEWYQPHHSFVVRNPLFPVEQFFNWKSQEGNTEASKEILRKHLQDFYRQPIVQEALYIGSPDLHEQMLLWLENKIDKPDKKEKTESSLVKYMIRMCTRCTPYGLFASCTRGTIADRTEIRIADKKNIERHARLDMDYVGEVLSHLLSRPEINEQLFFFPNTSLYPLGDNYRYIEHRFSKKSGRSYHLVQIAQSVYLEKILNAAKAGCSPKDLATVITDDDITSEEAVAFIEELIQSQVLISDLDPNVTGEEYFSLLLKKLKSLTHTEKYVEQFGKVVEEFKQIKSVSESPKNKFYPLIVEHLQHLEIPVHLKSLIQVDSYRSASDCSLNKKVCDDILHGASLLQLLSPENSMRDSFSDFKNAFMNRYESQWVPLVEVLDTESGIGYGKFATSGMEESPLIDKLPIGDGGSYSINQMRDAESFKWQLFQKAVLQNKTEVTIEDKTMEELSKNKVNSIGLPDSVYVMVKINALSSCDIDNGNYTLTMNSPSGPSGGNLLGRFCHLHPEIEKLTRTVLQNEEAHLPDAIFAEIVHLPESRTGNILMRPVLRNYEIPYLCGSTVEKEFQIAITDLWVGVENNKVMLRSKRLNKIVIPRMSTAHNFPMTTLPVYRFLCDLQFQQIKQYGWNWGILENRPFLPRVSYGKYIFSKAKWVLTKEDVKDCDKKNDTELFEIFAEVVKKRNLPQYILLSQGDNELLLDLKNIFCVKLLLPEVNKYQSVILTETLDRPEQCWMESSDGHHAGEFIFTFKKNITAPVPAVISHAKDEQKNIQRYFPVGSEWLYAKIYCGTKTGEKILSETLKPFTEELLLANIIDKYFFIRYHDSGSHVRIRFHHSANKNFWKEVISRLQVLLQPYMDNHSVYNLQFETYQREAERYGLDTMESSEDIFYHQSAAILNFISMIEGDEGEQYRWQVALKAIDIFLDDFGYPTLQKRDLIKSLSEIYSSEFKIDAPQQKIISERFSSNRKIIQYLMSDEWKADENLNRAISVFKIHHKDYRKAIQDILSAKSVNGNIQQLNYLMPGYLHMFINRMFIGNQRKVELVIYDYLLKYYESKIAREKNQKPSSASSDVKTIK